VSDIPKTRADWSSGDKYEPYVGRWSRLVAPEFLKWLAVPPDGFWLDVGCGTGALTQIILRDAKPAAVKGIDQSSGYVNYARAHTLDRRAGFSVGDAQNIPSDSSVFDATVSSLVLNFIPNMPLAVSEMKRVTKPSGVVGVYIWDYAGKMELMRYFWDTAISLDPSVAELDEGRRFPICKPEPLKKLFQEAGLDAVDVRPIDVPTYFRDFDDYWSPFLGGQGPAPSYAMSLDDARRSVLRDQIRAKLPIAPDGTISLVARAWAVRGRVG
jgi:SAM-dependent methyltransferase